MKKSILFMFHLLFWIIQSFLIIIIVKLSLAPANMFIKDGLSFSLKLLEFLYIVLPAALVFYAAYFSLRFFEKRPIRFLWLAIIYLIIISGVTLYDYFDATYYDTSRIDLWGILTTSFHILYFNVFGFLFRAFTEWIKDRKIKAELEKDKIASQMELLKSQINPHFLFNSLNNIDVLIQDEPKKASEYLKRLSQLAVF
jgi:two-component system LytT family sensor kinase